MANTFSEIYLQFVKEIKVESNEFANQKKSFKNESLELLREFKIPFEEKYCLILSIRRLLRSRWHPIWLFYKQDAPLG